MYDKVKHAIESERGADWRDQAACLTVDPELFFPVGSEKSGYVRDQIDKAKEVCGRCKVAEFCLRYALDNNEKFGVWGGLSEDERVALKRRNTRNRIGGQATTDSGILDI